LKKNKQQRKQEGAKMPDLFFSCHLISKFFCICHAWWYNRERIIFTGGATSL